MAQIHLAKTGFVKAFTAGTQAGSILMLMLRLAAVSQSMVSTIIPKEDEVR